LKARQAEFFIFFRRKKIKNSIKLEGKNSASLRSLRSIQFIKMKYLKILILLIVGTVLFQACKDDDGIQDLCSNSFDQKAMFENVADNIILPTYLRLQEKVDALADQTDLFISLTNENNLGELRTTFKEAYIVWQEAAQFEFGPAEEVFLQNSLNNFPVNITQVEFNIQNETNNFAQPDTYDQGFPAIDYLLYGVGGSADPVATVSVYVVNSDREKYKTYLDAIVKDIQQKVNTTVDKWQNGFRDSFVGNTGTAAGTSLSSVINSWNQNYELIKRNKIGVPSGVLDLNFPLPDKVEAFYSGISAQLALTALNASERLYLGIGENGTNGKSLDDFLQEVGAEKNGRPLNDVIKDQFTLAIDGVAALPDPLSADIENDEAPTVNAYTEITKQVVNIKTDLPSVLCVSITYVDNASDSD